MAGVKNRLTYREREAIIKYWGDLEKWELMDAIKRRHGYTNEQMLNRVKDIRAQLKQSGDMRCKTMYRITPVGDLPYNPNEIIKDHGVVHAPDIYADTDPRPCWLVINSPRFKISPTEMRG